MILTVSDMPVKNIGRWYTDEMKDTNQVQEVKDQMEDGLNPIDKCDFQGNLKIWCLQYGLMSSLMWPLTVYEIALSHVEHMERIIIVYICKWLSVPYSLSTTALYNSQTRVSLPMTSIVKEFKVAKIVHDTEGF